MYSIQRSISSQQITTSNSTCEQNSSTGGDIDKAKEPNIAESTNINRKLGRSMSANNCQIVNKRGFKPSDRFDPSKKAFLLSLSKQIWQRVRNITTNHRHLQQNVNTFFYLNTTRVSLLLLLLRPTHLINKTKKIYGVTT